MAFSSEFYELAPEEQERIFREAVESTRKYLHEQAIKDGLSEEEAVKASTRFCL